jgi:hypothetical protein
VHLILEISEGHPTRNSAWGMSEIPLKTDKVKIMDSLRLAVYRQSVHLGAQPLETLDQ